MKHTYTTFEAGAIVLKILHLSYAMSRLYGAVHRAQTAESPIARARAAQWARAWNVFIQKCIEQLRISTASESSFFDADSEREHGRTLH